MVENRYDGVLRKGNQAILSVTPGNHFLREELSLEIRELLKENPELKILEIGIGEGDLTAYVLKNNPSLKIDCLDISKEMIEISKKNLSKYLDQINFIEKDVSEYLSNLSIKYDLIIAAWTLHNFPKEDQKRVFEEIYSSLSENGKMLILEKIYPDDDSEKQFLLDQQSNRYRFLDKDVREAIILHEEQDFSNNYRLDESDTINLVKSIGFKRASIFDRVGRETLFLAERYKH